MKCIYKAGSNWINQRPKCFDWYKIKVPGSDANVQILQTFLQVVYGACIPSDTPLVATLGYRDRGDTSVMHLVLFRRPSEEWTHQPINPSTQQPSKEAKKVPQWGRHFI